MGRSMRNARVLMRRGIAHRHRRHERRSFGCSTSLPEFNHVQEIAPDRVGIGGEEDDEYDNDVSYLVNEDEDATGSGEGVVPPQLEEVHVRAAREDAASSSTALILDRLDHLLGVADGPSGGLRFS